jgi:hypothetical protein
MCTHLLFQDVHKSSMHRTCVDHTTGCVGSSSYAPFMMASVGRAAERRMRRFTTTEATATTATAAMEAITTVEIVAVDEVTAGIMLLFDPFFGCPFAGESFLDDPLVADLPDLPDLLLPGLCGDGDAVGDMVGDVVGEVVGDVVGEAVGDTVGDVVGDVVGEAVGDTVGDVVGDVVGEVVGDAVGAHPNVRLSI